MKMESIGYSAHMQEEPALETGGSRGHKSQGTQFCSPNIQGWDVSSS